MKKTLGPISIKIEGQQGSGKSILRNCIIQALIDISIDNKGEKAKPEFKIECVGEHNLEVRIRL